MNPAVRAVPVAGRFMTKYLLTCECGKTVPVEVGQAGEQVACQCGAKLDVPPLRKLRHLPVATETLERQDRRPGMRVKE